MSPIPVPASGLTSQTEYFSAHANDSASRRGSPDRPQRGFQARYAVDAHGRPYLVEELTGLPVNIVESSPSGIATSSGEAAVSTTRNGRSPSQTAAEAERSPSSTSQPSFDATEAGTVGQPGRVRSPDLILGPYAEMISRIPDGTLAPEELTKLHTFRGMFATSRDRLLASTVMIANQQDSLAHTHDEIIEVRDQTNSRLASLHNEVTGYQAKVNRCLTDNIQMLRDMGASDAALKDLLDISMNRERPSSSRATLPPLKSIHSRAVVPPEDIQSEMERVVPPRGHSESKQDYEQRIVNTIRRKDRTAATFSPRPHPAGNIIPDRAPQSGPREYLLKDHRGAPDQYIEDIGGISTAVPNRDVRFGGLPTTRTPSISYAAISRNASGFVPGSAEYVPATVFDEFTLDMAKTIRGIIDRQLGKAIVVPSHIRPPKVDPPVKYSGTDSHEIFIKFLERLCTWYRSHLITGPDTDDYRVTLLANHLDGYAQEWLTELTDPEGEPQFELTFPNIMCAMHKRFVTSANAQQAMVDFERVKYDPATGPDGLMNELIKYGQRMREKPSPFTIRSAFFRALPDDMYNHLVVDRGFTPEYSNAVDIVEHARQLWVGYRLARGRRRIANNPVPAGTRVNNTTKTSVGSSSRASNPPNRRPAAADARPTTAISPAAPAGNSKSDKQCFGCGAIGHIASDPMCPRNRDQPGFRDKPRVAAQRVLESYAEEPESAEMEESTDQDQGGVEQWGGSQYEPDDDDDRGPDCNDLRVQVTNIYCGMHVVRPWRVLGSYNGVVGTWISLQVPERVDIDKAGDSLDQKSVSKC
ncbi:hypothetical protein B0H11DRAFT_2282432 [Mycena galericulata]|nr:hypothetical protein B0H11DRAFT_2282432 [Mycena galericulata]